MIRHQPFGIEDPYNAQPWERSPRQPHEGDVVTVYAVCEPNAFLTAVDVEVETNLGQRDCIPAVPAPLAGVGDRWKAEIGAFRRSEVVRYRFLTGGSVRSRLVTEWFSFQTVGWRSLSLVSSWRATDSQVLLTLTDQSRTITTASFEVIAQTAVRIRFWTSTEVHVQPTPAATPCLVTEVGDALTVTAGDISIHIGLVTGAVRIESVLPSGNRLSLSSGSRSLLEWLGAEGGAHSVGVQFELFPREAVYGTGERFDSFDRRGLRSDNRVYEQYKNQRSRTYIPVPVVLSSRGYAIFVETLRQLYIDAGASDPNTLRIQADVGRGSTSGIDLYAFLAASPLQALEAYLRHAGKPALPPDWAFGLWMSSNDWNSQQRVLGEVHRGDEEGIHGDVVVIEAWSDEETFYIWNGAQHDTIPPDRPPCLSDFTFLPEGRWPDPQQMIKSLHATGTKVVLWQIPLMKPSETLDSQQSSDVRTVTERNWCVKDSHDNAYRNPSSWFTGAIVPDFTNPEAVEWWLSRRRYLVEELGIDGFKTDGGEHLWGAGLRFDDGRRGDELINAFPVLYAAAYHKLLREYRRDGLTFSRAGYAGSQLYPAHWAGDENSTWDAFRHSITAGLSAGASGIPFWGWDIAGFSEEIPSSELYRRAWMMSAFCPIMQYHSEFNANRAPSRDRTPWNIAERTGDPGLLAVCRYYLAIRKWLMPYVLRVARHSAATGRPLMCALSLEYYDDLQTRQYPYEYLFGRDLLVAPTVVEGCTEQRVYLPRGEWRHLENGSRQDGPIELTLNVPQDYIPVYVRNDAGPPLDAPLHGIVTAQQSVR